MICKSSVKILVLIGTLFALAACQTAEEKQAETAKREQFQRDFNERNNVQNRTFISNTHPELGTIRIRSTENMLGLDKKQYDHFLTLRPPEGGAFPSFEQAQDDAILRGVVYELQGDFVCPGRQISEYSRGQIGKLPNNTYRKSQTLKIALVNCS